MPDMEQQILQQAATASGDDELMPATQVQMPEKAPLYRVLGQAIPVSQSAGKLWSSRKDAALSKMRRLGYHDAWDEALRYFRNDQATQRATSGNAVGRTTFSRRNRRNQQVGDNGTGVAQDAENIVFANTSSLVPALYAKNPIIEVTPAIDDPDNIEGQPDLDDQRRQLANVGKKLVNALLSKKDSPGVNLKPKARKAVIITTLTNVGYIETGYTQKEDSQQDALQQIQALSQQLTQAQSPQDIEEIEGQLQSLEEEIDLLSPAGPFCKFRHPKSVLRDPDSTSSDLSDDNFIMIEDFVSTSWLHAKFYEKQGDGDWQSLFKASHVVAGNDTESTDDIMMEINTFSVLKQSESYKSYGYGSQDTFDNAKRTRVWYVWDKVTRRVYMFNDSDWSWPIWVWDDPYKFEGFFPLSCLQFYTDPEESIGPSEVSMYLDQVDGVNQINTEWAKIRNRAINTVFYNKRLIADKGTIDTYLNGNSMRAAVGVDMPLDADITKAIFAGLPPSAQYEKVFDKTQLYQAIDRMSSVSDVMRGEQFKTNTTNQAINTYNSNTQTRLDEKIDAVEDFIGDIGWKLLQVSFQFMHQDSVAQLIGQKAAASWQNMKPEDIANSFLLNVVGGSTQKPTSAIKKQEALQMAQALGQYGNAGGGAVVLTVLRILERAFDDFVIDTNDWDTIKQAIMTNLNRGNNAPPSGDPSQSGGQPGQQQLPPIEGLPPELQQLIATVAKKGNIPVPQAEAMVLQRLQQQQQGGEA